MTHQTGVLLLAGPLLTFMKLYISQLFPLDIDIGTNGDITYSFTPDTTRPFAIDSITGVITLTRRVTYSLTNEWYNYTINAMDSALDIDRRFGCAELAIRVGLSLQYITYILVYMEYSRTGVI